MKKNIYIAAAVCLGIGCVLTAGGVLAGGRPGVALDSQGIHMYGEQSREAHRLEKTELKEFSSVDMKLDYGDFHLIPSDGYYLEYCLNGSSQEPEYEVSSGKLTFREKPAVSYVQFHIMSFGVIESHESCYVNLYVPEDVYFEDFEFRSGSGDADLDQLTGDSIKLSMDYGTLCATRIQGDDVEIRLESGDLEADEVIGTKNLKISMEYGSLSAEALEAEQEGKLLLESGNLHLDSCMVGDMKMQLEYGDMKVQEMKGKSLELESGSGNVKIGKLILENRGSLALEYGDATIGLGDAASAYTMKLDTEYGEITAPDLGRLTSEDGEKSFRLTGTEEKELIINCESGDIKVQEVF